MRKVEFRSVAAGDGSGSTTASDATPSQPAGAVGDLRGAGAHTSARRLALLLMIASCLLVLLSLGGAWLLISHGL